MSRIIIILISVDFRNNSFVLMVCRVVFHTYMVRYATTKCSITDQHDADDCVSICSCNLWCFACETVRLCRNLMERTAANIIYVFGLMWTNLWLISSGDFDSFLMLLPCKCWQSHFITTNKILSILFGKRIRFIKHESKNRNSCTSNLPPASWISTHC